MAEMTVDEVTQSSKLFEDITPDKDGGVTKTLIRKGEGEDRPFNGCTVHVHYVGRFVNGETFDSSRDRGEVFSFPVGKSKVIKGWDLAVLTMQKDEICEIKVSPQYGYGENGFPPKIPENSTLLFEIELLSWEDEEITTDGGVKKRVVNEGEGITKPNLDAHVKVHIRGTYKGNLFDERDVEFVIGDGDKKGIVEGIEKALLKMTRHERAKVFIKPAYGFKDIGHEEFGVPPEADIEYEICLFNFDKALELYEMNYDEKLVKAKVLKDRGLQCFRKAEYTKAIEQFDRVLKFVQINQQDSDYPRGVPFNISTNSNMALCYLKLKDYPNTILHCTKVLKLDPDNVKVLFRKGEAHLGTDDYGLAAECFNHALTIEPENSAVKKQLQYSKVMIKKQFEKEKKLYSNIFAKMSE